MRVWASVGPGVAASRQIAPVKLNIEVGKLGRTRTRAGKISSFGGCRKACAVRRAPEFPSAPVFIAQAGVLLPTRVPRCAACQPSWSVLFASGMEGRHITVAAEPLPRAATTV